MKMHNAPHSWPDLLELLQSWWRGVILPSNSGHAAK